MTSSSRIASGIRIGSLLLAGALVVLALTVGQDLGPAPVELTEGEALDFWRVESIEKDRFLRLRAEMKVPGKAWLQWRVDEDGAGTHLRQSAIFAPKGLLGLVYWYLLLPVHAYMFSALANAIAREAEESR